MVWGVSLGIGPVSSCVQLLQLLNRGVQAPVICCVEPLLAHLVLAKLQTEFCRIWKRGGWFQTDTDVLPV